MHIIKYDPEKASPTRIKIIVDACARVSNTDVSEWLALPHDIDLIQNVPVEHLKVIRDIIEARIKDLEN